MPILWDAKAGRLLDVGVEFRASMVTVHLTNKQKKKIKKVIF